MTKQDNPSALDAELSWLIRETRITTPSAERRLNALENAVTNLARPWRPTAPIVPERDLRMSEATRDQLLAWVEACEVVLANDRLSDRLRVYASRAIVDPSVPHGRIRLLLRRA